MELLTHPVLVSGNTPDELAAAAHRQRTEIDSTPAEDLPELLHRWSSAPAASVRGAVVAPDRAGLLSGLNALAQGRPARTAVRGTADVGGKPVLVFPGQGPSWPGMATELLSSLPGFRAQVGGYGTALRSHLDGWDPGVALADGAELGRLALIQPAQFALSCALADTWRARGLRETAVVGHSVGEIAAAHACGALNAEDAVRLLARYGAALTRIEGKGAMASVAASADRVRPLLEKWRGRLGLSAVNSPRNVTVSGDQDAVAELLAELTEAGLWAWQVPGIDVAGHSPQVDALREMVLEGAGHARPGESRSAFYSTATGTRLDGTGLTAEYWYRSMRGVVLFEQAVRALVEDGHRLFIELSAHPTLTTVIGETLRAAGVTGAVIPTLDRRKGDVASFQFALATAWVNGVPVAWDDTGDRITVSRAETTETQGDNGFLAPETLRTASPAEQRRILVDLIADATHRTLGRTFSSAGQTFREIGFSSLNLVEFAGALSATTGLDLTHTVVYDHPSPLALADHLRRELGPARTVHAPAARTADLAEPIAVVGIGCRFPGGVTSAESLWDLVISGRDAVGEWPADRGWDTERLYHPTAGEVGRISTRHGGFLHEAAEFDAGFFGLSPREATAMEPQQRLLLEVSWEAIEHAGIDPVSLRGSNTGVFAGVIGQEYGPRLHQASDDVAGHAFLGTALCVASGRISYTLGLEGPAITMDTACSSSLVAIHQAGQALRAGDCDLALAGGATVMSGPGILVDFSRQRVLAPDGRCKAFSATADGIGLSEGVGMVLLERLSDARANGHPVLAVIRGSAVNQDGASNGLSAPSGSAQQRVIRHALANAGLTAQDVDVVEAHGTGTRIGDPIEAHALLATYGQGRPPERPVLVGSIKSNFAHTQAAAGVAGLIKMVMALRHRLLPRSLHVAAPSDQVNWSAGAMRVLTEQQRWPDVGRPSRAAVSSFGVSGTNSHLIVEQAPDPDQSTVDKTTPAVVLWPLAAKTDTALRAQAVRLRQHLTGRPGLDPAELDLADIGYSLGTTRGGFPHRAVIRGRSSAELLGGLAALGEQRDHALLVRGVAPPPGKLVFVFPGQGAQWPGMGMGLYDEFPVYRHALDEADAALRPFTGWSVVDLLRDATALERVDVVHPALFAVMTALARLWRSFGVVPDAVIGHSQGEITAACVAGALTLPQAAKLVALRAQTLTGGLSGNGAMATLGVPADQAERLIAPYDGRISVAAVNSPAATVVSGDAGVVAELVQRCQADGVRAQRIQVEVAGHSAHIDPLRDRILQLADITPAPFRIAFHSTVDGHTQDGPLDSAALTAEYWFDNLRNTVRLADTVRSLAGHGVFLECSPHALLVPAVEETLSGGALTVGTLRRNKPEADSFAQAVARLHVHGHDVDWQALYPSARRVELPTYPFERRRYWLAQPDAADVAAAGQRASEHPFLTAAVDLPDDEGVLLTGRIGLATQPWLADHGAAGVVLLPGTAYLDMVLHAAALVECAHVAELTLVAPLVLPDQDAVDLRLRIGSPGDDGHRPVSLHARPRTEAEWTLHATARLSRQPAAPITGPTGWPPPAAASVDLAVLRGSIAEAGYDYGPAFTGLRTVWRDGDHFYAEADLPDDLANTGHTLHPALLDTALHPLAAPDTADTGTRLPFSFTGITWTGTPTTTLRIHLHRTRPDTVRVVATDGAGAPVLSIESLTLRGTTGDQLRRHARTSPEHDLLYVSWHPLPPAAAPDTSGWVQLGTTALPDLTVGTPPPRMVIRHLPESAPCTDVLAFLREWLADERLTGTVLAVVTRNAVTTAQHEPAPLAHGPAWGVLHTAQNENPGRIVLVDTDGHPDSDLTIALGSGQPRTAVRRGVVHVPHLTRSTASDVLAVPDTRTWRLETTGAGGLDRLALVPHPEAAAPLLPGQVRLDVRAAGMNFVDTAAALGLIGPQPGLGAEAAGVVTEVGPGVERFAAGDRVTGLVRRAFGPVAVADERLLAHVPDGWSFAEAAGVPVAFATAYYALVDVAKVRPGETVLVHSAAGGVGQAAAQLVRYLGAVPLGTAHPDKWGTLRDLGFAEEHIASSRTLEFAERFPAVDVVLNSLAGPFVDASLDLVARGGRFVELGKTDIRDPERLATTHPHLTYQVVDLHPDAGPDRIGEMLDELLPLFRAGTLTPIPVTAYGIRHAARAFRLMRDAGHTGKIVLTFPRPLDPGGTVLITGGTGTLGGLLARHLVTAHGVRHLVLASRRGPLGADELRADLERAGATVTITACDVADPDALEQLLGAIGPERPLTGVFHTAGVLADGTIASLTADDFEKVFAPKADAAWHLHERTRHLDLAAFVLYSSTSATFGNPGQANYVAANTFLDALAHERARWGLPGTSVAWGWWQPVSGLTGELTGTDNARIARTGLAPISAEHGHALLDAALELPHPVVTASPLNQRILRANADMGTLHPLLQRLTPTQTTRQSTTTAGSAAALRDELATLAPETRLRRLRTTITTHAAAVLGLDDPSALPPEQPFRSFGFDSLTALELRNRLATATSLQLPATLTYDHPSPDELAAHLDTLLSPDGGEERPTEDEDTRIREVISSIPLSRLRELGLLDGLLRAAAGPAPALPGIEDISTASVDELVALAMAEDETS